MNRKICCIRGHIVISRTHTFKLRRFQVTWKQIILDNFAVSLSDSVYTNYLFQRFSKYFLGSIDLVWGCHFKNIRSNDDNNNHKAISLCFGLVRCVESTFFIRWKLSDAIIYLLQFHEIVSFRFLITWLKRSRTLQNHMSLDSLFYFFRFGCHHSVRPVVSFIVIYLESATIFEKKKIRFWIFKTALSDFVPKHTFLN